MKTTKTVEQLLSISAICVLLAAALADPVTAAQPSSPDRAAQPSNSESIVAPEATNHTAISEIIGKINDQIQALKSYLNDTLLSQVKALSENLGEDFQSAVEGAIGDLGLPDPEKARKEIQESAATSDAVMYSGDRPANEVDRQTARAAAAQSLSEEGQKQQLEAVAATQQSVSQVGQLAEQAQQDVATQDVVKRMAAQNQEMAATVGAMRADGLANQQRQDLTNVQLSNISRAVDGEQNQKQAQTTGAGLETLQYTSRARLF